jgi:hypothetical protein
MVASANKRHLDFQIVKTKQQKTHVPFTGAAHPTTYFQEIIQKQR